MAVFALALPLGACTEASPSPSASSPATPTPTAVAARSVTPPVAATATLPPPTARGITIAAIGDVMLDRDVEALIVEHGDGYPWSRVSDLFEGADIVLANLEGTFTARGSAADKRYTFRTDPSLGGTLSAGGIDLVTLANNHTTDFGDAGLADTLTTLDALGIGHFGAGLDERSARAPLVRMVEGTSIAFLGYADSGNTRFADGERAGVARAELRAMRAEIAAASAAHDLVVVTLHTGVEYAAAPSSHQRELAHAAVEAGADLVIGHHPHVLQPWERIGDALILYSLGNFVFDLDADDLVTLGAGPFLTAVALIHLSPDAAPTLEIRPAFIDPLENRPRPATVQEAAAVRERLSELVDELVDD